ncbi:hypothetical protein HHI36_019733 [Cryptolaemus montrouzieri]|uniref:Uncharacterized protein n=1 Tax=Cryptolaemus montrouzieri TaxID=559131 RepID=A0ABD2N8Q1_9CUCU
MSEKLSMRRAIAKREQYRYLKAHVRKEDGRLHAYGWSLPGKITPATKGASSGVPVPVPVYCRPLAESSPGMNIWCAAGVTPMDSYLKHSLESEEPYAAREASADGDSEQIANELNPPSSKVWICSFTHTASIVTIIDANNPAEILDSFGVCTSRILCIASIPAYGANDKPNDTPVNCSSTLNSPTEESEKIVKDVEDIPTIMTEGAKQIDKDFEIQEELKVLGNVYFVENEASATNCRAVIREQFKTDSGSIDENKCEVQMNAEETGTEASNEESSKLKTGIDEEDARAGKMETMWMGTENGSIYIHSSLYNCSKCLQSVKLRDAIMNIVYINGQVVVALACGMMAVFRRTSEGEWDLSKYYSVKLGLPQHAVRCLTVVEDSVWCGYRNKIHILQPSGLKIIHTIEAHPRRESPVRQMVWLGVGVWISIRLDSTLRLYHAHTYQHLQDVDIEPYVSKMLGTGKLGFTFVRITCLMVSSYRLWIGTANGVIISVPLPGEGSCDGKIIRSTNLSAATTEYDTPVPSEGFIPYCSMAHAQLSFHGHRANVKFFVAVPGNGGTSPSSKPSSPTHSPVSSDHSNTMLVMSGGEGYIDFRIGAKEKQNVDVDLVTMYKFHQLPPNKRKRTFVQLRRLPKEVAANYVLKLTIKNILIQLFYVTSVIRYNFF